MEVADAIDRARRLQEEGKADEALELLLEAAREHPCEDLDGEIALFYAERGLSRPDDEAEKDFEEAQSWHDLPLAVAGLARIALRRGDLERSEALAGRALEMDPEFPLALFAKGCLELKRGKAAAAAELLAKAVAGAPRFGEGYAVLSLALVQAGRLPEAEEALLRGMKECPGDDELLLAAGGFWRASNQPARARQAFRRAAEINRFNAEAWRCVARAASEEGDEVETHEALGRAMEIDPDGTRAWLEKEKPLPGADGR